MRQLTASQKIAILENRVAHLEKQAMLEGLKAKIADAMSPFKRLFPHTKKIIKDTRKSPKQIAQEYMKVRKDPNFKKGMKQLQREAGSSPVKQVAYVIDAYKSGELDATPRTASMSRRGGALLAMTFAAGLSGAILATICIVDICYQWVASQVKGLFKSSSLRKEANPTILIMAKIIVLVLSTVVVSMNITKSSEKSKFFAGFLRAVFGPAEVDWDFHYSSWTRLKYAGDLTVPNGKVRVTFKYEGLDLTNLTMTIEDEIVFEGTEEEMMRSVWMIQNEIASRPSISYLISE